MKFHIYLAVVIAAVFIKSIFFPGWYTGVEFVGALAAFVTFTKLVPPQSKIKHEEIEQMKKIIENLASQVKQTSNGLTGMRLALGLKEHK